MEAMGNDNPETALEFLKKVDDKLYQLQRLYGESDYSRDLPLDF